MAGIISRVALTLVCVVFVYQMAYASSRPPKVAGAFYPADPNELRDMVTGFLEQHPLPDPSSPKPRILILPHAGYPYSGIVAAKGFRQVQGIPYDAVVVVAFTHRDQFTGTSVDDREEYETPLGKIPVDMEAANYLKTQKGIHHLERSHASDEHSLEVMLPFLQVALKGFKLVPMLMGSQNYEDAKYLADALQGLSEKGNYLFVFSTDLSHYHTYEKAKMLDETTITAILYETPEAIYRMYRSGFIEACGGSPILSALMLGDRLGFLERKLLLSANSGDTSGQKDRVVGYAAIGMYERKAESRAGLISKETGEALVKAARATLENYFKRNDIKSPDLESFPELNRHQGIFVTLTKQGKLRGCIGHIESDRPIHEILPGIALDSALRDYRFSPLTSAELDEIEVEVSVLTPLSKVKDASEIIAGRDGVVIEMGNRRGVFLPQVWETGMTRVEFLQELASQKAGLDKNAWQSAQLFTFQDQVFKEDNPHQ